MWQKVDSKLDKIYEYQQQMNNVNLAHDDHQQVYNKFGEAIVGLVQNLVNGGNPSQESAKEFSKLFEKVNLSSDQIPSSDTYKNQEK